MLVRGPLVMAGYRNEPAMTASTIDADGWLHTGDIGALDTDGYLSIVDRKKEIIINSAGKNMTPANIEARLKAAHPLIGQAVAVGDRRPYVVALLVLDPEAAVAFAAGHGIDDASTAALAQHPSVRDALSEAVRIANRKLSRVEQVKTFAIVGDDWQPGGDELTPTMKLKRKPIVPSTPSASMRCTPSAAPRTRSRRSDQRRATITRRVSGPNAPPSRSPQALASANPARSTMASSSVAV